MISFTSLAAKATKILADNSPLILTAIGATGVGATAYLTHQAATKSVKQIQEVAESGTWVEPPTNTDKFKLVWLNYLPPVGVGVISVTSIIFANRIGAGRAAALATAVTLANNDLDEYKAKVKEKLGIQKEQKLTDEVAKDRVLNNPGGQSIILAGGDEVLFYDMSTDRYFKNTMQDIRGAEMDIQRQIMNNDTASLSDWYLQVGLKRTSLSDELGWNAKNPFQLQITATEDGAGMRPCFAINFRKDPIRKFHRLAAGD